MNGIEWGRWHMPVIEVTVEAEIGGLPIRDQPQQMRPCLKVKN